MKYIVLTLVLFIGTFNAFSQFENQSSQSDALASGWSLSAGFNSISSIGDRNPFGKIGEWGFKNPISVGAEYAWPTGFAIEQSITLNGFSAGDEVDGQELTEDATYFSTDTAFKYYFGTHIFPEVDWLDLFAGT
ncbi:MAG: hypothetical protein KJO22_02160, partial [Bacteroidia bacterium]|nr:hypothetical protein [Bacteroidia bacterium]